jgi:hypothetical protein
MTIVTKWVNKNGDAWLGVDSTNCKTNLKSRKAQVYHVKKNVKQGFGIGT